MMLIRMDRRDAGAVTMRRAPGPAAIVLLAIVSLMVIARPLPAEELGPVSMQSDVAAVEIARAAFRDSVANPADFSGKHLAYLDLSTLDLKGARFARSDFYGTDFTGADLSGADLSQTRLDRAVLIKADLSGANLFGATILRPTVYTDMSESHADAPRFVGANLGRIRVQANLSGANFQGADLTAADFSPLEARPGQGTLVTLSRNVLKSCDFSKVRAVDAKFTNAVLWFTSFTGADLRGADFSDADLTNVDFTGANVTGADFTGADLDGANFSGAVGFASAVGIDLAVNVNKATF